MVKGLCSYLSTTLVAAAGQGAVTDLRNRASANPTIEALDDVAVQVHNYDAETGRTGGGTFNVATRSGTNTWRASAFYQNRPKWGQANNYFSEKAGVPLPDTYFHLGGGGHQGIVGTREPTQPTLGGQVAGLRSRGGGDPFHRPSRLRVRIEQVAGDHEQVYLLGQGEVDGRPERGELPLPLRGRLLAEVGVAGPEVDVGRMEQSQHREPL